MAATFDAFREAWRLVVSFDAELREIVGLSLRVSVTAVLLAALVGLPFGAWLALNRFRGRRLVVVLNDALMGLPPVVVGLVVYLLLARSGPFGGLEWLFKREAMVLAQFLVVLPILAALSRQVVEDLWEEYAEQLKSLGVSRNRAIPTLLIDGRKRLVTALLAGFGRAIGEVGAVLIVGGNIAHHTRVMTTAIALETSKGALELALGLGIVLIVIAVIVNAGAQLLR
ncbi:MAG: ABC transporter permease [Planctomycetota bacterium]|jgi:tungstate transport system permease protein